jgi:hemolysin activation/secretion protein
MNPKAVFATACILAPTAVHGLGADDASRPTPPPDSRSGERSVRKEPPDGAGDIAGEDQVLLPELLGLAIATDAGMALELQAVEAREVVLKGFTAREERGIRQAVADSVGRPVSVRSLAELTARIEENYRLLGRPFIRVSFPPQEITSGVVALRIGPAMAGRVLLAGRPAFGTEFAAAAFRQKPGEIVSDSTVLEDLDWLNENPLRRASVSHTEGGTPDTLDLTLRLRSAKAWRVYAGIDNQLSDALGDERLFLGLQHGDLFQLDHRLTAQLTSSLDVANLHGVSGVYEIPLPVRHLLEISAGYTESESDVAGPIDQSGEFSRFALGYRIPLPRWESVGHEVRFGMEFRNNDYLFSNATTQTVRFFNLSTGWKARRSDRFGTNRLDTSLVWSPGGGILGSEDEDFIALGGSGAESLIARLEGERTLRLGTAATLAFRGSAQWADSDLLSSDQISAGGVNRVRGFDETVGYASNGAVAGLELRSRDYQMSRAGEWQGLLFMDGALLDRDTVADAGQLASVGAGLRWRFGERLSARADLGFPIEAPAAEDDSPVLHFFISSYW